MTQACSASRIAVGEPLAGSAPRADAWVLIEQPGPWGRNVLTDSHLPPAVAASLTQLGDSRPVRTGLIRAVGAHRDVDAGPRTLIVARVDAMDPWISVRQVDDLGSLVMLDAVSILASETPPADLPGVAVSEVTGVDLVCTNARRDQCCAVLGRPLAARLAAEIGTGRQTWETSHTGGHRFAPTFVSLPDGFLFGGPAADQRGLDDCRGRSSLSPQAQVAELAVLRHLGAVTPRPLAVSGDGGHWEVQDDASGLRFMVQVDRRDGPPRPESCGKPPVPSHSWCASTPRVI